VDLSRFLPPPGIAPFAPVLDREGLRAAIFPRGPWPRHLDSLGALVAEVHGLPVTDWSPRPELAITQDLPGPLAVPALLPPSWAEALRHRDILWLDAGVLPEPGIDAVEAALERGARAVLLVPLTGDLGSVLAVEGLCRGRGVPVVMDARWAAGSRCLGRPVHDIGDRALLGPDGEPPPSICGGAFLAGGGVLDPRPTGPPGSARALLRRLPLDEPRLRRLWPRRWSPDELRAEPAPGAPPGWAVAAASTRLRASPARAAQRARIHAALRQDLAHLPRAALPALSPSSQPAGGAFVLRCVARDAVALALHHAGIATRPDFAVRVAPTGLAPHAERWERDGLWLPVHPFFDPPTLRGLGEALRRALLQAA
jgi:hypothetical protein